MSTSLYSKTPSVTVLDNRALAVRIIAYHRHPDTPDITDERITRHQFDARGLPSQSADPRLYAAGLANFSYLHGLNGMTLRTQSADAGTSVALNDASGRAFLQVSNIGTGNERSAAVTRTFQYEEADLPGRLRGITEQVAGDSARVTERFIWGGASADEQSHNLAGQPVSHYDPAGLLSTGSVSLGGVPLSVTRQLLPDDAEADWQGADTSAWNDLLAGKTYTTNSTVDAAGNVLTTLDAKGNLQRVAFDVTGLLKGSWLTVNGGSEQVIVKSLTYSAAGQKLREEHGNGVVTTYSYEAETQRLVGIKTERVSATKMLQDLRYEYDPVGNVLVITNDAEETRFWRNQQVVPENTYTYDSLYQLVSATGREMANAVQQNSNLPGFTSFDSATYTNYSRIYTYDNAGNLTKIQHSVPASGNSYTVNMTVSDRSNRAVLSTLTENPADVEALFTAGGQQKQLLPGQSLLWTARQELQKVTPVTRYGAADDSERYRYDAGSQRVLKITSHLTGSTTQTKRVIYLPGLELRSSAAEELQVITVGVAGRAQVRVLHWESGQPAGITNDPIRYSYDNLTGSSALEVDASGELISQEEYYPYGGTALFAARSQLEADYKTIRYSGKEQDATGLYYYGYRYYQPWAGRWLSADPAGSIDGINLFRMCRNNPASFFDRNGYDSFSVPNKEEHVHGAGADEGEDEPEEELTLKNLFQPEKKPLPYMVQERLEGKLEAKADKQKRNILFISAKPNPFSFDQTHKATVEFSKQKMNYLMHKGHNVTGAYVNSIKEFTETWNAIGKGRLKNIDKVIIDYHGAISPKRGFQSVIILSTDPMELLDKSFIDMLESKGLVNVVSLYTCYSGFIEKYNPAVGFLTKLTSPGARTIGFDAQGNNDMMILKTLRHPEAGDQFDNALAKLNIRRMQYGRVQYSNAENNEVLVQHRTGKFNFPMSKYTG